MCEDGHFNLAERILCSDDMCIGLVGADGRCKMCGIQYDGALPLPPPTSEVGGEGTERSPTMNAGVAADGRAQTEASAEEPGPASVGGVDTVPERVPCSDEMCVGIVGESGKCGVCGKSEKTP